MAEAFKVRLWLHFYLSLIQARNKGSIPPDLHKALMNQVKQGLLRVMDVEVISAVRRDGLSLRDKNEKVIQQTGTILLATAFKSSMPGKDWLTRVIQSLIYAARNVVIRLYRSHCSVDLV